MTTGGILLSLEWFVKRGNGNTEILSQGFIETQKLALRKHMRVEFPKKVL
jgi:hypothetical protein